MREIYWKASIVFNCDGLAQTHIWAPYDQIGLSITLYKINLLETNLKTLLEQYNYIFYQPKFVFDYTIVGKK